MCILHIYLIFIIIIYYYFLTFSLKVCGYVEIVHKMTKYDICYFINHLVDYIYIWTLEYSNNYFIVGRLFVGV